MAVETQPVPDTAAKTQDIHVQLDAIFQAFPDLLFCINSDGIILNYRAGDPSLLYLSPERFIRRRMPEILPPQIGDQFEKALEDVRKTGQIGVVKYQLSTPKGECWFDARLVPSVQSRVIVIVRDITEHVKISEQAHLQLRQLAALRSIDAAISSSFDLTVTLSVILRETVNQLAVDAADILLFNPGTKMLEFAAGKGFRMPNVRRPAVHLGEGYAGVAVLERRTVSVGTADGQAIEAIPLSDLGREGFVSYYAVPLIAKGQIKGVLEIYHCSPLTPGDDWLEFLNMLAGQAALAIDSAALFLDLQKMNSELGAAYDAVIESWSQALEISGREDREHIQNVVRITNQLAQRMGVGEDELVHIRHGALLHDVGKMGIPDSILHSPGPLNDAEWKVIRDHPRVAHQMLSAVTYFAPALSIPLHHHERWDGNGYPHGLYGEQIPLAARIFSVVEVYDALTSPRPYRPAWTTPQALDYIRNEAGKQFDPTVVKSFLQIMV
jgi:HD-GYP domain-containing protein (c-di-GMP phosphodiesterase class II)